MHHSFLIHLSADGHLGWEALILKKKLFVFVYAGSLLLCWLFTSWGRAGATLLVAMCWLLSAAASLVVGHGLKGE